MQLTRRYLLIYFLLKSKFIMLIHYFFGSINLLFPTLTLNTRIPIVF